MQDYITYDNTITNDTNLQTTNVHRHRYYITRYLLHNVHNFTRHIVTLLFTSITCYIFYNDQRRRRRRKRRALRGEGLESFMQI